MKEEVEHSLINLKNAFNKLQEGISLADDDLKKDGVIQRFGFTFELLWKTLKIFLGDQGIRVHSPKESLKEAFRYGLIEDEALFLDMLSDRNKTTHLYSKEDSEDIYRNIKDKYVEGIKSVIEKLNSD